ncbi:hypothetical protein R3W88_016832 [Solanum pinnatisectum]|uniref:Uncharacterized protein n=1 Tax=Solanum pinnatisectum TaxID=50273 RepID=A0AAV9KYQ1_9SOLN|nr:hypothetical protein R3W88_016832 [Solanum pinnatisectum]
MYLFFFIKNIASTSIPTTVPDFQEGHFAHSPSTDQMFEQRSSSITMAFSNNDPIEVDVVEAQEQNHILEQKAVEVRVDTCKYKEGMNDAFDLPHTTNVHDKASVSKKNNEEAIGGSKISQQENLDEVQHNVNKSDAVVESNDKSVNFIIIYRFYNFEFNISFGTQKAVDALLYGLHAPMNAQPLQAVTPQQITGTHDLISDYQLPMYIIGNEIVVHEELKTPVQRLRQSSKIFQSLYLTNLGPVTC